jgi:hypothetical protein
LTLRQREFVNRRIPLDFRQFVIRHADPFRGVNDRGVLPCE